MERIKSHKDLQVWIRSIDLVTKIYKITEQFPSGEKYGLVSQLWRAGVSVPSNIAEGAARKTSKEFIQFLSISIGSLAEIDTQLIFSENLNYLRNVEKIQDEVKSIKLMIRSLIEKLKKKI